MLRFLIIRPDRMGDAIITQVVIAALIETVPCKIDLFASSYSYKFYEDNPHIQNIFYCDIENKQETISYYKSVCTKTSYDAVFVLQARRRLQKLSLLNKSAIRVGFNLVFDKRATSKVFQWVMDTFHRFIYVNYNALQHEALNMSRVVEAGLARLGLPKLANLPDRCKLYSGQIPILAKISNSVVINVSGKMDEQKIILPSMLAALILLLPATTKIAVVVFKNDKPMVEDIINKISQSNPGYCNVDIISNPDVFTIAALINTFEYYIGADGGLLHIAAALGLKCVGLYNEKVSVLWHPWTPDQVSLSSGISYTISPVAVINALSKLGFSMTNYATDGAI